MSWIETNLGECCELYQPQTITTKDLIEDGKYLVYGANGVIGRYDKYNHEEPQLLVTCRGATCGAVNISIPYSWINGNAMVVKPKHKSIDVRFVEYFFRGAVDLRRAITGAAQPQITRQSLNPIKFQYPPLLAQQKIVAKLDAIFAEINTATAAAEANTKNAEALFQSYLTEVFERGGEGWVVKKLKDITEKIGSGATPRGGNESYKASGISLIRSMNVYDEGFYYPKLAFIDEAQAKELDNVKVENEDVLLNITGASVARCCVVPEDVLPARVNQHVSILRANKNIIIPKLIHYILISPVHKNKLLSVGEDGGATRQALTKAQLLDYEINFPSDLSSQLKLVEKISNFYSYTFSIKNNYEEKIRNFPSLKQSILQKAFSGELVKD